MTVTIPGLFDGPRLLRTIWHERFSEKTIDNWWSDHQREEPFCRWTYIYAVQVGEDGPIKFGISDDPEGRVKGIQTHNHEKVYLTLAVRGCKHVERLIHGDLLPHRIHGEWFRYEGRVIQTHDALMMLEEDENDEALWG